MTRVAWMLGLAGLAAVLWLGQPAEAQPCVSTGPPNDCFGTPVTVPQSPWSGSGTTLGATMETGEPTGCCSMSKSIWYTWTPAVSGTGIVTTCGSTALAGFTMDTVINVYTGTQLATLTYVTGNDQSSLCPNINESRVAFTCTAGVTYRIQVAMWSSATGGPVMVNVSGCAPPPVARNDPHNVVVGTYAGYYQAMEDTQLNVLATYPPPGSPYASCDNTKGLLCNDDHPTASLTASLVVDTTSYVTGSLSGTLADVDATNTRAKGAFRYTPTANTCGPKSFQYKAKDIGNVQSPLATAYLFVTCTHDAPVAAANTYSVNEGAVLTVTSNSACTSGINYDLLCNDSDPDTNDFDTVNTAGNKDLSGPKNKVILCSQPVHGVVTLTATQETGGGFTYTPNANVVDQNWYGVDGFSYKLRDGRTDGPIVETPCVNVTLNIANVADAPVAVADAFTGVPNTGPSTFGGPLGLLVNDYDYDNLAPTPANQGLTTVISPTPTLSCPGGTGHSITGWGTAGGFTFTPPTSPVNYAGTCSFSYRVTDGALTSGLATVSLQVVTPTAPSAGHDGCITNEDTAIASPVPGCVALSLNDVLFTGAAGPATYTLVTPPPASEGSVVLSGSGGYTFTPAANFNGVTWFRYKFTQDPDGPGPSQPQDSNIAYVFVTVVSINDPPTATPKTYNINEDCSAVPASSCAAPYFVVPATCGGAVKGLMCEVAGFDFDPYDSPDSPSIQVAVPVPAPSMANPLLTGKGRIVAMSSTGGFTYIPNPHAFGVDTFTFQMRDGGSSTSPHVNTSPPIMVTIQIAAVADAPVALPDSCGQTFALSYAPYVPTCVSASPYRAYFGHILLVEPGLGLLSNDYMPDNYPSSPLSNAGMSVDCAGVCSLGAGQGSLTVRSDGGFTYIPPSDVSPTCENLSFTYRARYQTAISSVASVGIRLCPNVGPMASFTMSSNDVVQGQTVVFTDTSSDSDSSIVTWYWQFGDGLTSAETSPIHRYDRPGTYQVRLVVTDDVGDTSDAVADLTVQYPPDPVSESSLHQAFSVEAGADQSVESGSAVRLRAEALGRTNPAYVWRQVSGPVVDVQGTRTAYLTFLAPDVPTGKPDVLVFEVVAQSGSEVSAADQVRVTVTAVNQLPVLDIGDVTVEAGTVAHLDASNSYDPEGEPLAFTWTQTEGSPVTTDVGAGVLRFTAPADGQSLRLVFRVEASDGTQVASKDVVVRIVQKAPEVVVMVLEPVGGDGLLRAHARVLGRSYVWDFGDNETARGPDVVHPYAQGGVYTVTLHVDDGATIRSFTKQVVVPEFLAATVPMDVDPVKPAAKSAHAASVGLGILAVAAVALRRRA